MKEITCAQIAAAVERLCVKASVWLPADMAMQIECACDCEVSPEGAAALNDIMENYKFAAEKNLQSVRTPVWQWFLQRWDRRCT